MASVTSLMTAEEYMALPDSFDGPTELVKGILIEMTPPPPRHGEICMQIGYLLRKYLESNPIGRVVCNDSSMLTERSPDSVRGPDVSYYSFSKTPKGPLPGGLLPVSPEVVFEVFSPTDRWSKLHEKIAEYLAAGVLTVCVLDDDTRTMHVFHADREPQILAAGDDFTLPAILDEFCVRVQQFFD